MLHVIGILIGLTVLIVLVYNRVNLSLSVIIATLIIGLTNGLHITDAFSFFATGVGSFLSSVLMVFFCAAVYAQVFTDSGSAASISYFIIDLFKGSRYAVLTIPIITALLVYGGISVFVVIFAVIPIGVLMLKETNLNKSLLPGLINFGGTTFAMTALPGTPQLCNILPANLLGTRPTAAPLLGLVATAILILLGFLYFKRQIDKYRARGLVFDESTVTPAQMAVIPREKCPPVWKAFLPMVTMMVIYLGLANGWFSVTMAAFPAVNTAMVIGTVLTFLLNIKEYRSLITAVKVGSGQWVMPLVNLCMVIGMGAVVKVTPGFETVVRIALSMPGNAYVSAAVSTDLVAGITGSASGGIQIALESLADSWLATGANAEALHRICAVASGGLDSLPHAGGMFAVFILCNETYKNGYIHIFWTTVVFPIIATIVIVAMASAGITI